MRYLQHEGAALAYQAIGAGPTLLLLHGGLSDSETDFSSIIPRLAERFTVVAMDTRGQGRSSWGGTSLSYRRFADDAAALLRHLAAGPAIVMGLSDGGIAGLHLAAHHPVAVVRLITIGSSADISGDTPLGGPAIREFTAEMFAISQAKRLARWRELSPAPEEILPYINALMHQVWRLPVYITPAELAQITAATAIVQGDHDEYVTLEHAAALQAAIPGGVLAIVPDATHLILDSNPVAAWRVLAPLLGY